MHNQAKIIDMLTLHLTKNTNFASEKIKNLELTTYLFVPLWLEKKIFALPIKKSGARNK